MNKNTCNTNISQKEKNIIKKKLKDKLNIFSEKIKKRKIEIEQRSDKKILKDFKFKKHPI